MALGSNMVNNSSTYFPGGRSYDDWKVTANPIENTIDYTEHIDYILNLTEKDYYMLWQGGMYYNPEFDEYGNALPFRNVDINLNLNNLDTDYAQNPNHKWALFHKYVDPNWRPSDIALDTTEDGLYGERKGTTSSKSAQNQYGESYGLLSQEHLFGTVYQNLPEEFYYRGFKVVNGEVVEAPSDLTNLIIPGERIPLEYGDSKRYPEDSAWFWNDDEGNAGYRRRYKDQRYEVDLTSVSPENAISMVQDLVDVFYRKGEYGPEFLERDREVLIELESGDLVGQDDFILDSTVYQNLTEHIKFGHMRSKERGGESLIDPFNLLTDNKISGDLSAALTTLGGGESWYNLNDTGYEAALDKTGLSQLANPYGQLETVTFPLSSQDYATLGTTSFGSQKFYNFDYSSGRPWYYNPIRWNNEKTLKSSIQNFVHTAPYGGLITLPDGTVEKTEPYYGLDPNDPNSSLLVLRDKDLDWRMTWAAENNLGYSDMKDFLALTSTINPSSMTDESGLGTGILKVGKAIFKPLWELTKWTGRTGGKLTGILKRETPFGNFSARSAQWVAGGLTGYSGYQQLAWQNEYAPYGDINNTRNILDPFYNTKLKTLLEYGQLDGLNEVTQNLVSEGLLKNGMSVKDQYTVMDEALSQYTSTFYPYGFKLWSDPSTTYDIVNKESPTRIDRLLTDQVAHGDMSLILEMSEGNMEVARFIVNDMVENPTEWGELNHEYSPLELFEGIKLYRSLDDIQATQYITEDFKTSQVLEAYNDLEVAMSNFYAGEDLEGNLDQYYLMEELNRVQTWIMQMDQFLPSDRRFFTPSNDQYVFGGIALPGSPDSDGRYGVNQRYFSKDDFKINMDLYLQDIMHYFNPHHGADDLAIFLTDSDGYTVNPENLGYGSADWQWPASWLTFEGSSFQQIGQILPGTQNPSYNVKIPELNIDYTTTKYRLNHPSEAEIYWQMMFLSNEALNKSIPTYVANKDDVNALNSHIMWHQGFQHMFMGDGLGIMGLDSSSGNDGSNSYSFYDYNGNETSHYDLTFNKADRIVNTSNLEKEVFDQTGQNTKIDTVNPSDSTFHALKNVYGLHHTPDGSSLDYTFNIGFYEYAKRLQTVYDAQSSINKMKVTSPSGSLSK